MSCVDGIQGAAHSMRIKKEQHDPELHLRNPRTRKWMAQCVLCKRWGFRHDAPSQTFGRTPLERHLGEMHLNDRGVCDRCRVTQT